MRSTALFALLLALGSRSQGILQWNEYSDHKCKKAQSFRPVSEMWPPQAFNCQNHGEGIRSFRIADDMSYLEDHMCKLKVYTHPNCNEDDVIKTFAELTGNTCHDLPAPDGSNKKWVSPLGARSSRLKCTKAKHWNELVPFGTEGPTWVTSTKHKTVDTASDLEAATATTDPLTEMVAGGPSSTTLGTTTSSEGVEYSILTTVMPASTVVLEDGVPVSTIGMEDAPAEATGAADTLTEMVAEGPSSTTPGTTTSSEGVAYSIRTTVMPASTVVLEDGVPVSTIGTVDAPAEATEAL